MARIDALTAPDAGVVVNGDMIAGPVVAVLDGTGCDAGVTVDTQCRIDIDDRCQRMGGNECGHGHSFFHGDAEIWLKDVVRRQTL